MRASFVKKSIAHSPLAEAQTLVANGKSTKKRSELAPILPLTSLIDAFCIIVIYLLIGTQTSGTEMNVPSQMVLPSAESGIAVETSPVVRIDKGQYFLNDQPVALSALSSQLYQLKSALPAGQDMQVIVQADQKMDYADLDPLIKSTSQAGVQKLKFAVMPIQ